MSYEDRFRALAEKFEKQVEKGRITPEILRAYKKEQARLLRELADEISEHADDLEDITFQ